LGFPTSCYLEAINEFSGAIAGDLKKKEKLPRQLRASKTSVDLAHAYTMFDFNQLPQASMIIWFLTCDTTLCFG
jgi:hypothetical protein